MKRVITASAVGLVLAIVCSADARELVSDSDADEFAKAALNGMWGRALDEHDRSLQPVDERDRQIIPIPTADVRRVARAGAPAGIASWAGLDWQSYYDAFMKQERRSRRWSGKQIAFIGVLFGVSQGSFEKSCEKMPRDAKGRDWAADVLADAKRKFLGKV
jgi:hypothetical protein